MRKLASIQKVAELRAIEGADNANNYTCNNGVKVSK